MSEHPSTRLDPGLLTPVYVKLRDDEPWPEDEVFYVLSRDGLHLCRNHRFYRSAVPARRFPGELGGQATFLRLQGFPRVPRALVERAVGFFHEAWRRHGSEAGLLLVWSDARREMRLVCPEQEATVSHGWSGTYPLDLRYTVPMLAEGDTLVGDLHSHGDEPAYASATDRADEVGRSGLHVVVGRLASIDYGGRPQFHTDIVADGTRFRVSAEVAMEGYTAPDREFPAQWLDMLRVAPEPPAPRSRTVHGDHAADFSPAPSADPLSGGLP